MTVFGKGLSRLLVLYISTRHWQAASLPSPPPSPLLSARTCTLLITVLDLYSNKKANSHEVGLNNITFPSFSNLWNVRKMSLNTKCCKRRERGCWICLSRIDIFIRKRTRIFQLMTIDSEWQREPSKFPSPCTPPHPTLCRQGIGGPEETVFCWRSHSTLTWGRSLVVASALLFPPL